MELTDRGPRNVKSPIANLRNLICKIMPFLGFFCYLNIIFQDIALEELSHLNILETFINTS